MKHRLLLVVSVFLFFSIFFFLFPLKIPLKTKGWIIIQSGLSCFGRCRFDRQCGSLAKCIGEKCCIVITPTQPHVPTPINPALEIVKIIDAPWSKRLGFSTVVFNNKIWIIGGQLSIKTGSSDVWAYSLNQDPTIPLSPTTSFCDKKPQGDANCDGNITDFDYKIWKCEFLGGGSCLSPSSQKTADFNLDTKVDLIDFEIWRQNRFASTPTPTVTPTQTPTPTATPVPVSSDLIVLNSGLGISCSQLCSLVGERCLEAGTDLNASNNRFVVYEFNRCTISSNSTSPCSVNLRNNSFIECSDSGGNNSDKNPHPADWTYCRCSNSHSLINCTSDGQCSPQKVCATNIGKCVIPSCEMINSCQFIQFNNHRCEIWNKSDGAQCVIFGTMPLIIGQCKAGECVVSSGCEGCTKSGACPDYCRSSY